MSIRRTIASSLLAAGLAAGATVVAAPAAQAGTSIGTTKNAKTGDWYKFYASTNQFCVKTTYDKYIAETKFYLSGKLKYTLKSTKRDRWACATLTKHGMKEGQRIKFALVAIWAPDGGHAAPNSYGYLTI